MKASLLVAILFASPPCADMNAGNFVQACLSPVGSAGDQLYPSGWRRCCTSTPPA